MRSWGRLTTEREAKGPAVRVACVATEAFGLPLRLPDGLLTHALRPATVGDERPPTVVTVESEPFDPWVGGTVERVRERRDAGAVTWTVDVDPERGFRMQAAELVTMVISHDGRVVRCAPGSRAADSGWSALVPAQALPLAATLRHLEVLHASAVSVRGSALAFCASPGVGKSSLAAQLVLRGAGLLSDDAVAIDEDLVVHPATGALHLRQAELARLDQAARDQLGIRAATRLDGRVIGSVSPAAPAPLCAVCLLERAAAGPVIESIEAVDPTILLGSTFNLSVQSPARLLRHLDFCARVATQVPVLRLRITPDVDAAALAERVLACL